MVTHQLDAGFKQAKDARARRRRARRLRRVAVFATVAAATGIGAFLVVNVGVFQSLLGFDERFEAVSVGVEAAADADVFVPAIVDLPGNPMKISLGSGGAEFTRYVPRPDTVSFERVSSDIAVLTDTMITVSEQFMTTLPSSPKDFAFYQSQRVANRRVDEIASAAILENAAIDGGAQTTGGDTAVTAGLSDWGEELPEGAAVQRTAIENTTSVATVRPESQRFQPTGDYIGRILVNQTLESVMAENRFSPADATYFADVMRAEFGKETLVAGDIIAIRGVRESPTSTVLRVVQVSLYAAGSYVGTLNRSDAGAVVRGADPWVPDELFNFGGASEVAEAGRQYRLLDAIYSTAARNKVPTGVLGEAIMLLSRSFDLNAFASERDRLVLAYARDGLDDGGGVGRVLYVGVQGPDRNLECFVFKLAGDGEYSCFSENSSGQSVSMPAGMVTPVSGVLTSTFGPRMHPIFKEVRNHSGVDWAAPTGTPISTAFSGTIKAMGDGGGYGNLVRVSHPGGRESLYAHMSRFADGMAVGNAVRAGDVIGYVGTTGNSTGPHLHFELHVGGTAVDPLQSATATIGESSAVDALTDRIVQVESGGNATAKNPLSTATGLGQFIESTWIRMMNTYRPDLATSMSREDLLALRNDPTISREMVANLAREGESYLRARGHQITAGRLYLCHFLGMEGASTVLSADPVLPLLDVLGPGVISANPFLTGKDVAYVIDWAERKMSGSRRAPAPPPRVVSPEFRIYQAAIQGIIAPPGEAEPPVTTAALN